MYIIYNIYREKEREYLTKISFIFVKAFDYVLINYISMYI